MAQGDDWSAVEASGLEPGPNILLGVSGSIAAYKSAELIRRLRERGAIVRVVMTAHAEAFITPLSLQALSGAPVRRALFDPAAEAGMSHIELARWADRMLIAPASANCIARLALGLADDLLTTLALASRAPLSIAPAMNQAMWTHPATQSHIECLRARGVQVLGPAAGGQACGDRGPGRMLEPDAIVACLLPAQPVSLVGHGVLMTAGPTREALDPVRFLGNRSSGKMGYALADALTELGARVTLVSGPTALPVPRVAEFVRVESALEMDAAVRERVGACALFVACAAVADYRPARARAEKLKKSAEPMTLELVPNPDIVAGVTARPRPPFTVGFAAETGDLEAQARVKLVAKRLDMIAANRVAAAEGGFERDDNALLVLWSDGERAFPLLPKTQLARALAALIAQRYVASVAG